jgi:hypothetical protein
MPDNDPHPAETTQAQQPAVEKRIGESALQVAQTAGIVMGGAGGLVGGIATAVGVAKSGQGQAPPPPRDQAAPPAHQPPAGNEKP